MKLFAKYIFSSWLVLLCAVNTLSRADAEVMTNVVSTQSIKATNLIGTNSLVVTSNNRFNVKLSSSNIVNVVVVTNSNPANSFLVNINFGVITNPPEIKKLADSDSDGKCDWCKVFDVLLKFFGVIAWPLVVGILFMVYRGDVSQLIGRIENARWGSAGVEFAKNVEAVQRRSGRLFFGDNFQNFKYIELAELSPRVAILEVWLEVESALARLLEKKNILNDRKQIPKSTLEMIRLVRLDGYINEEHEKLFKELLVLRNQAVHSINFSTTFEAVIKYINLAENLASVIKKSID